MNEYEDVSKSYLHERSRPEKDPPQDRNKSPDIVYYNYWDGKFSVAKYGPKSDKYVKVRST